MARRRLIGAVLLLCLSGCEDGSEPAHVPVPATTSEAPAPDAGFVTAVRQDLPHLAVDRREEEIVALAEQTCTALAARRPADAVVGEVRAFGADGASARELVRLAITTVCPEQGRRAGEF
jgi:hypothetical protein